MTVIRPSSISGITSITSPSSSDFLSIHTNNTTEVARVTTSGINVTGVITATSFSGPVSSATGDFSIADKIVHTGDTNTALRFPAADTITAETAGSERLRIASGGKIGIGENNPQRELHLTTAGNCGIRIEGGTSHTCQVLFTPAGGTEHQGRIGYYHGSNTMDFYTGAAERLRIDSSGRLLVGQTANYTAYADSKLQVGATDSTASIQVTRWSNNGSSPYINLGKSRGGLGSYTVVQSGDRLGQINFVGADGTDLASHSASIAAYVDGTPGSNDMPGRLVFATASDGGVAETERLRITSGGNIGVAGATGTDFSLLDGMVVNVANGSAGLLINSSSSSHNAYLGFSYGSGSSTSHADQFSAYLGRVGDNQLIFGTNNVIRGQVSPTGGLQWGLPGSSSSLPGAHGALNVRALANGNLHVRASTDLQGGTTGVGLDVLNDAANTVQDLVIRGATTIFRNASAETLRITSAGKIGIGCDPDYTLDVRAASGDVWVSARGGTNQGFQVRKADNTLIGYYGNGGGVGFGVNDNAVSAPAGNLIFQTGGTSSSNERLRITNTGRTELRKDSECLRLMPTTSGNAVYMEFYDDGNSSRQGFFGFGSNTETTSTMHMHNNRNGHLEFRTNNTVHFRINSNGDLQGTDTSISSLSDSRLKKNVADFVYDLSKFKQFKPKTFEWINTDKHSSGTQRGFIAQDLEGVDAELTGEASLDAELQASDITTLGGSNKAKTARLGKNDTMYVSVIQQLITKIETLEAKVTALESS